MKKPTLLIADDEPSILLVLEDLLEGHYDVRAFDDGKPLLDYLLQGGKADLVLTDVMMPGIDGFEVCRQVKSSPATRDVPLLFLTGLDSDTDEAYALSLGAEDFIHKPVSPPVVLSRIRNHLDLAEARRELKRRNFELEKIVEERTREIVRRGEQLIASHEATIAALCNLAEVRDKETGNHILRTQHYVRLLAEALKDHPRFRADLTEECRLMIFRSAPLHDVGKVAIPDDILHKPGRLDPDEWTIMRRHCEYGRDALERAAGTLEEGGDAYLKVAVNIAYSHHERWDGTGYPQGLAGDAIPVCARLMAVADVYDALITKRVYKTAFPHEQAVKMIAVERGRQFDPDVVDAFVKLSGEFDEIARRYRDEG